MAPRDESTDPALQELRAFGLTYPGAHIKSPWPGHGDLAVNDKTFAYLSVEGDPFKLSCKLPHSCDDALGLPFVEPTEYGLGKSGWVTARPPAGPVPIELFKAWIDESYRAQAPKRLLAALTVGAATSSELPAAPASRAARAKQAGKKRPAKKVAAKQAAVTKLATKKAALKKTAKKPRAAAATRAGTQRVAGKKRRAKASPAARARRPG